MPNHYRSPCSASCRFQARFNGYLCAFRSGNDPFLEGFVNLASRISSPAAARSWSGEPVCCVSYLRRVDASDNHHGTACANPVQVVVGLVPRRVLHFSVSHLIDPTCMSSLNNREESNRRCTSPFRSSRKFASRICAPPPLSAAVAHSNRYA